MSTCQAVGTAMPFASSQKSILHCRSEEKEGVIPELPLVAANAKEVSRGRRR